MKKFKEVSVGTTDLNAEVGYELLRVAENDSLDVMTMVRNQESGQHEVTVASSNGRSDEFLSFDTLDEATANFESRLA